MWIAQSPSGAWHAYVDQPRLKLGGWDGLPSVQLKIDMYIVSWRETLREVSDTEYRHRYWHKEIRHDEV